ncbi:hypothetical protein J6590_099671 [Homalodisca vitripennis]|nr:hypothetical protein J6590_099671 [Homalodisca vitripennis]
MCTCYYFLGNDPGRFIELTSIQSSPKAGYLNSSRTVIGFLAECGKKSEFHIHPGQGSLISSQIGVDKSSSGAEDWNWTVGGSRNSELAHSSNNEEQLGSVVRHGPPAARSCGLNILRCPRARESVSALVGLVPAALCSLFYLSAVTQ